MRKKVFYPLLLGLMLLFVVMGSCKEDNDPQHEQKPFLIEATNGPNGTIAPSGVTEVVSRHPDFKITPDEGYVRDSLIVNGKMVTEDTLRFSTYVVDTQKEFRFFTLDTVYSTIHVTFKKIP
jgi:hypothetical protein